MLTEREISFARWIVILLDYPLLHYDWILYVPTHLH